MISVSTPNYTAAVLAAERQAARAGLPTDGNQVVPVQVAEATATSSRSTSSGPGTGRVIDIQV